MIAISCQACGTELTAGESACRQCGIATWPPAEPGPAGQHNADQVGTRMGVAAWRPAPLPYLLEGGATWLTALLATFAVAILGGLAVPRSSDAATALGVVALLMMALTGPVFLVWLYRASRNADQPCLYPQRWSPGWATVAWFVPVICLWVPYQIVADIWRAGQPPERRVRIPWLVVAWWLCLLLAWAAACLPRDTARNLHLGFYLHSTILYWLFLTAAAVLLILIIRTVANGLGSDYRGLTVPGFPAATRPPRRGRRGLIIGIAATLVATGGGAAIGATVHLSDTGAVRLPSRLLGFIKYTGPGAGDINGRLTRHLARDGYTHPTAAIYASRAGLGGPLFVILGGGYSVSQGPAPAEEVRRALAAEGFADARQFPSGAKGGTLVCGEQIIDGTAVDGCIWADSISVGEVRYVHGSAASPADAAAKTNQIRAAIEHGTVSPIPDRHPAVVT